MKQSFLDLSKIHFSLSENGIERVYVVICCHVASQFLDFIIILLMLSSTWC